MITLPGEFQTFFNSEKIYTPDQISEVLKEVRPFFRFSWSNKKLKYFNVPACFDIETSSFIVDGEKQGCMYEWTLGVFGLVIVGRTWEEFVKCINEMSNELQLNNQKRFIIYCHNLAFEFQWLRHYFTWEKVFSVNMRKPLYALADNGIEFRCSLLLSGYSLANVGKNLQKYKVTKAVGDLDYTKIRHSNTPLTQTEIGYCVRDVRVVMGYVAERIEQDGGISRIPLTKTGYVRKYCRNSCFYDPKKQDQYKRLKYRALMLNMKLQPDEYIQLKRGFQGGFTHANPFYSDQTMYDVTSFDFTSSYPAVMLAEKFPSSSAEHIYIGSREELEENMKLYCCIFDVEFINIESRLLFDSYISQSRCFLLDKPTINNGRVVRADMLRTTITEQDFYIISAMYEWDAMRVSNFRRYRKNYLPTDFVKSILKLYQDKTELKGVDGQEVNYMRAKEQLNSCYGMAVTDIVRPEYGYDTEWREPKNPELHKAIEKYNSSPGRFLFFPWGCWVTAYARRNLFTGILEFQNDYIYSDTDSIKVLRAENHMEYINKYNERITEQLERAMEFHGLPKDSIAPKNKKGERKPLGVWSFDGHYEKYKSLGAKRYLVKYSQDPRNGSEKGEYSMTVAGLNKRDAMRYIIDLGADPFEFFTRDMYIPAGHTGKLTHTYIDDEIRGVVVDYNGDPGEYHERSCIHLGAADYSLSIAREYADYIRNVQTEGY